MPFLTASDGVKLYYEEAGKGTPIVFVHEFAGDYRSWEPQMRYFSRRHRVIAYNTRGYPPSDVPKAGNKYSQARAVDDIADVMKHLKLRKAHIVGCSMGGFAVLHFGIHYARLALSITAIGAGFGSDPTKRAQFVKDTKMQIARFHAEGMAKAIAEYKKGPSRVQYLNKDPRGFNEFCSQFEEHSALGSANTMAGVQSKRQTIYQMEKGLRAFKPPLLVVTGDEDDSCLDPGVFIKRVCPTAQLCVVPGTGHAVNLEEPGFTNTLLTEFIALVESGRWRPRDPRSLAKSAFYADKK